MECPESWFEDFGEARLSEGRAVVSIDPDFAALVDTGRYHVFLTSYGPASLYVHRRSPEGFEVRAMKSMEGRSHDGEAAFSYRVVARRRDIEAPRFQPFEFQPGAEEPIPDVIVAPAPQERLDHTNLG